MQPQQFLDLVQCAFFESNTQRSSAEQVLLKYKDECPDEFMVYCAQAFSNRGIQNRIRVACSTLVKRLVGLIHPPSNQITWLACSQQTKNDVKLKFMEQLIDPENTIRRSAANTISEICAIELPRQEWPDLISRLTTNSKHTDILIKVSAIMTLGYICEALKTHQSSGISEQDSKVILMGICVGMDLNEQTLEIRLTAIKALQDSLYFMNNLFKQQEIFTYVKNLILSNAICNIQEVKHKALQCLIDFVKQLFTFLPAFINELFQTTQASFENQGEISIAAIEIWNTICAEMKEEITQNGNQQTPESNAVDCCVQFFKKNYEGFLLPFMRNLLLDSGDVDDEYQGLSVPDSSCKGLAFIIDFAGVNTYELVKNFIQNTLTHQQWEYRKASVMAFGALAEVQTKEIEILIKSALSNLFTCLIDQHYKVKKATAQTLSRVAENYPQCFHEHDQANHMLATLLDQLNNKISIVQHLIWVFVYLTEQLQLFSNSIFNREKFTILQHLASTSVRADIKNSEIALIDTAFMAILNIIYSVTDTKLCNDYLIQFFQQIQLLESGTQVPAEIKYHLEMGLMSAMHGCVVRLDDSTTPESVFESIMKTLSNVDSRVKNDYFYVLSGIAYAFKKKLSKYSSQLIGELNKPLSEPDDMESFKTALFCLADIARAMEEEFVPYMNILNYFFGLIKNPNFNRELKLQVYNAIADIILGLKEKSFQFLGDLKEILKLGFAASMDLTKSQQNVDQDYAERLKETMTSFYTCILHAYCEPNIPNFDLRDTVDWFIIFCTEMCSLKLKPTIEYVRLTLCCIFDCSHFFQTVPEMKIKLKDFITSDFVIELIRKMSQFNDKDYQECVSFAKQLLNDVYGFQLKLY
ncbi:unnamed protein product [Paramecium primaurelia]|uniref:Importin subunit beta-1/Transportin-1-like TPR repeats domain-containing protein n=1 Tax=Paramecium primaurelia TaxID=5886 RepID=A0A8S1QBM5_PARPR|nr:unnamed protein product [Paramecium primaurelia]